MGFRGVNLGNWLVLEKWMGDSPLWEAASKDDRGLIDELDPTVRPPALKNHYATYITEADFQWLKEVGVDLVRIPIPYHLFGTDHHIPCVDHLDDAFRWAEEAGISILTDLHTVPLSQNGFDNGGYLGLCAWAQDQRRIDSVVDMLEKTARRYAGSAALWGIEALNEPVSKRELASTLHRAAKLFPDRAARSKAIPRKVLLAFYDQVYRRLRPIVGDDVVLVFHDQFELESWNRLLPTKTYRNVALDTHLYLNFSEQGFKRFDLSEYQAKVRQFSKRVRRASRHHPLIVGEWSLGNHSPLKRTLGDDELRAFYRTLADAQMRAWDQALGGCFWSYKVATSSLRPDWCLRECITRGWLSMQV